MMVVELVATAVGTVTAEFVAKATPLAVSTCVPAGMATASSVFPLVKVTVPVAAVSTTFWPVAANVPLA